MMMAGPPKPTDRPTAATVALVKSAPAGALVGLFGFWLVAVRSDVAHAAEPTSARPPNPLINILCIESSEVGGGGSVHELQAESEAAIGRHGRELEPLIIVAAVGEFGIDVRDARVSPQVAAEHGQ